MKNYKKKDIPLGAKYYSLPTPGEDIVGKYYFYFEILDENKYSLLRKRHSFFSLREAMDYCFELRKTLKKFGLIETRILDDTINPRGHQYPYI